MDRTKLLLIPCSGDETLQLAKNIESILRNDYGLEPESLDCLRRRDVPKDTQKTHTHPLVSDYFPDMEVQADIGRNWLKDVIRGKHVVLVEHLLTPDRLASPKSPQTVGVNDHVMTVRGFLDVIRKAGGKEDVPQITLISPYLNYVRSHSIEKYEARGFFQFDSLRLTLGDYYSGGLGSLITIDAHSEKAAQIANDLGIDYHSINPFQSSRAINPAKLGLTGEKAKEMLKRNRPFQESFKGLREEYGDHLYVVSVDDGTERRAENFAERAFSDLPTELAYTKLVYFEKDRGTYQMSTQKFKPFSAIKEDNVDPQGVYVIIDDMYSSGKTVNTVAKILKDLGAKRVEARITHAVTVPEQYQEANQRTFLDRVVCLDTVPHTEGLQVEYIPATSDLVAADLYKIHQKLVAGR